MKMKTWISNNFNNKKIIKTPKKVEVFVKQVIKVKRNIIAGGEFNTQNDISPSNIKSKNGKEIFSFVHNPKKSRSQERP